MIDKTKLILSRILFISILIPSNHVLINAAVEVTNLMIEYSKNPISIDVKNPRFSWTRHPTPPELPLCLVLTTAGYWIKTKISLE